MVSLISELAADMLCRQCGLTPVSIILNAAGKFTLILPNTESTRIKIREVEENINRWLIKNFYGESALGVSYVEASSIDFTSQRFSELWEALSKEREKRKYSRIDLEKHGGVISDYLDQFNNTLSKKLYPFCGKRPSDSEVEGEPLIGEEESACKICRDHIYIGTTLVKAERIAITTVDAKIFGDKLCEPIFETYQVSLDVTGRLRNLAESGHLLKYWDISISSDGQIARDITAKFISGYVPIYTRDDESEEALNRLLHGRKTERSKNELFDMIEKGHPKSFHHMAGFRKKKSIGQ